MLKDDITGNAGSRGHSQARAPEESQTLGPAMREHLPPKIRHQLRLVCNIGPLLYQLI